MSKVRAIPQYRGGPAISKFRTFARYRDGDIEFHDCPGLAKCINHPKWSVLFGQRGRWEAIAPGQEYGSRSHFFLTSHAEAIAYADREARREC